MTSSAPALTEALLVPINVQAFATPGDEEPPWNMLPMPRSTEQLRRWYAGSAGLDRWPFSPPLTPLAAGVHLHWAPPAALLHVRHVDGESPRQRRLPNRWLVVRMWRAAASPATPWRLRATVIEADHMGADDASDDAAGAPWLFADAPGGPACARVGSEFDAASWSESNPDYRFDLRADGPGHAGFAAYYPACKGVLGHHDPLDGVGEGDALTYVVVGWHSAPAHDPLGGDTADALGWAPVDDHGATPRRSLCHGMVVGLRKGRRADARPAAATTGRVALGCSAADALATLLADQAPAAEADALQAVLRVLAEHPPERFDEIGSLDEAGHREAFSARPGGTAWEIAPAASTPGQASPPQPTRRQRRLLDHLNIRQLALDRQARVQRSLHDQAFDAWSAWRLAQTGPVPSRPARNVAAIDASATHLDARRALANKVDRLAARLRASLARSSAETSVGGSGAATSALQLGATTADPFLQAKDPFVVIDRPDLRGPDRLHARGPDGTTPVALPCRNATQLLTGVRLTGTEFAQWKADARLALHEPEKTLGSLATLRPLLLEALCLDPEAAPTLVDARRTEHLRMLQNRGGTEAVDAGCTLSWEGRPPHGLAITRSGSAPWLPVFLAWQAEWTPDGQAAADGSSPWALDGPPVEAAPVSPPEPGAQRVLLQGATLVSAVSASTLALHLRKLAEAMPGARTHLSAIEQGPWLGQCLAGFGDALLAQRPGIALPPINPDGQVDLPAWIARRAGGRTTVPASGPLLPTRAGTLRLLELQIVDTFGRGRKVLGAPATGASTGLRVAPSLRPDPASGDARLAPRLTQPARLRAEWTPAASPETGPVCGWIVPNLIDQCLSVHEAEGQALGRLQAVIRHDDGERAVVIGWRWQPRPGNEGAGADIARIADERLRRFVRLVTTLDGESASALSELVDEVLRKADAHPALDHPALGVLIGRPLALARVGLTLELEGLPAARWRRNRGEGVPWSMDTSGIEHLRVPVRVGQFARESDGAIGFIDDAQPDQFHPVAGAPRRTADGRLRYGQDLSVAAGDPQLRQLTLLFDATARVHLRSGLLPTLALELPPHALAAAARIDAVDFAVAPVLGDPGAPALPRPSDAFGRWSWATRPGVGWAPLRPADTQARFSGPVALSEGWVRLELPTHSGTRGNGVPPTDETGA